MNDAPVDAGELHPSRMLTVPVVARGEVWEDGNPPPTKK